MAKILVVDDSDVERIAMITILKKAGHTTIEARNGEDAVNVAMTHMPDMVFMDIVMPIKDGFTATKKLKMEPSTKNIPVVMVSSKSQESDRFRAKQLGARGYLVKPASAATVLPIISQLL